MLGKFILPSQSWQKYFIRILSFVLISISTLFFLLCIAAFTITKIDTPEYILVPLTTILITVSSFIDGFLLARTIHENGILIGIITGLIFSAIIIITGLYYGTFAFTGLFFSKVAAVVLAGVLGGILGVNC